MIVISGALVLVALILLVIGVVGPELSFVYASIAVSLVSLVFLIIGILQRRGEQPAGEQPAPEQEEVAQAPADAVTAVIPAQAGAPTSRRRPADEDLDEAETAALVQDDDDAEMAPGTVLIVEGRPRYHVDGCRYLAGKEVDEIDVLDARDEGFTACGVCKPDAALAAQVVEEDVPGVEVAPSARRTAPAAKVPAKKAPAKKAAAKATGGSPSKAATAAAKATPAGVAAATKAGSVVVIPDRGKYHRAECRYVRGVDEAEVLSKSAATRQGYAACGVCKP